MSVPASEKHVGRTAAMARKAALVIAAAVTLVVAGATSGVGVAHADGGPHGGYTATGGTTGGLPDQCAGCHRVHQGSSPFRLLKRANPSQLCLSCHNGEGSQLDVVDGRRLDAIEAPNAAVVSVQTMPGFTLSIAPSAIRYAAAGGTAEFALVVKNTGYSNTNENPSVPFTASVSESPNPDFESATLAPTSFQADVGEVVYLRLRVPIRATATDGAEQLTSVTVTGNGLSHGVVSATVTVMTRVGSASTGSTLNGGGFYFVNGAPVTSKHNVQFDWQNTDTTDGSEYPWGFLYPTSGQTTNTGQNSNWMGFSLQCTSCHNPHGSSNYRILRSWLFGYSQPVNVKAWYAGALTANEGAPGLRAGAPADKYVKEYYASEGTGAAPITGAGSLASLCGKCHVAYPSNGASEGYAGGGVTHYRHRTEMPFTNWANPDNGRTSQNPETNALSGFPALRLASNATNDNTIVTCLTCHRVHGTSSTMEGYALKSSLGGLADDDLSPAQTSASRSTLLFTNNRAMCQACHQWGIAP